MLNIIIILVALVLAGQSKTLPHRRLRLVRFGTTFIGAETPIGPLYMGYGYTEGGRSRWYLAIGDHF